MEYLIKAFLIYEKTIDLNHPYMEELLRWMDLVKQAMNPTSETNELFLCNLFKK